MAEKWYDGLFPEAEGALLRAERILEELKSALPPEKAGAADEARALLRRACALYAQTKRAVDESRGPGGAGTAQ